MIQFNTSCKNLFSNQLLGQEKLPRKINLALGQVKIGVQWPGWQVNLASVVSQGSVSENDSLIK